MFSFALSGPSNITDTRSGRQLLFVSYKLGHSKDIQCSTISSWIRNIIKFCYSKVDAADMDLIGVKAHDVRAFAASKALYGETSMDQIMQACQYFHQILSQRPCWSRPERRLLPSGILCCSSAGHASTLAPGKKNGGGGGGHYLGNYLDGVCQNRLTP